MTVRPSRLYLLVFSGLLLAAACRKAESPSGYRARIGIAVKLNDRVCLAIENSKLLPSATVTLLQPAGVAGERPVSARAFVLSRNAATCPGTKDDEEASYYDLEITTGSVQPNVPLIALDARVPSVYAAHSFHSCASPDGIHLTAWDGAKPLEGHRLWKQYYYLSQDRRQNCTAPETSP